MLSAGDALAVARVALDDPAALWCRVVDARGLGGVAGGESAVVACGEVIAGRVLRGVLDADLLRLAAKPTAGDASAYSVGLTVTQGTATAAGLVCGGRVELFVQPVSSVPALLWEAIGAGRPVTVVTALSGP